MKKEKLAVISLSGGMDSSSLLLNLLKKGYNCTCLGFDYGQKHKIELERAAELVEYINDQSEYLKSTHQDVQFPKVTFQVIKLDGLSSLLNSSLVTGGDDVPEGHYENENMRQTVVPNRNKIFASIIQAVALSRAVEKDTTCIISLGVHAGDHAIYPDCRQEFRDADFEAFKLGNWESERVTYETPYLEIDKFGILEDGLDSCKYLGLDFDEVYKRTNTSYKPIMHHVMVPVEGKPGHTQYLHKWFSDYKSASSVERIEAFIKLGKPDPVEYADLEGPVSWEIAKAHVELVLEANKLNSQDSHSTFNQTK